MAAAMRSSGVVVRWVREPVSSYMPRASSVASSGLIAIFSLPENINQKGCRGAKILNYLKFATEIPAISYMMIIQVEFYIRVHQAFRERTNSLWQTGYPPG